MAETRVVAGLLTEPLDATEGLLSFGRPAVEHSAESGDSRRTECPRTKLGCASRLKLLRLQLFVEPVGENLDFLVPQNDARREGILQSLPRNLQCSKQSSRLRGGLTLCTAKGLSFAASPARHLRFMRCDDNEWLMDKPVETGGFLLKIHRTSGN